MSSQSSRVGLPYNPPGYVTYSKRKSDDPRDEAGKKRRIVNAPAPSDSEGEEESDEEDFAPMSETQLNRHSKVSASISAKEVDPNKVLDSKLQRIVMKSQAAQHRDNRKHPLPAQNSYRSPVASSPASNGGARFVKCLWRAPQTRKHKTWDGDGVLILSSAGTRLMDANNKQLLASGFKLKSGFEQGQVYTAGSKEIEIEFDISADSYRSGNYVAIQQAPPKPVVRRIPVQAPLQQIEPAQQFKTPSKLPIRGQRVEEVTPTVEKKTVVTASTSSVPAKSFYEKTRRDTERINKVKPSGLFNTETAESSKPRHDPKKSGSIVMKRPDAAHQKRFNKKGLQIVDVVVNPILAQQLRPHQIEGIRFLYEKVMGMRINENDQSLGAILADEMGLGKTLQTITVIDMLLNQNCYLSPTRRVGAIERALIVCPLSLVKNWAREFRKWLGKDKIKVQCIGDKNKIGNTINGNYQVLIIGYEKLLISHKDVASVQPKFGLLVCDEAHRLKNQAAKTSQMLGALPIEQRILLTGTPIQNNLLEFHAVVDLVSPGLMGNKKTFKSIFEEPIMRSRVAGCSKKVLEKGELMSEALQVVTQGLLLRRTADILSDYLPPKHEMVVFCSPTPLQIQLYELMINSDRVHDIVSGNALHSFALTAIGILCKLCNSPELLVKGLASNGISEGGTTKALLTGLRDHLPTKVMNIAEMSGKLLCVMKMLIRIKEQTNDKVVLISNFTSTLDILESLCRKKKFTFARLDGKTKQEDRINYINSFNQSDQNSQFIFLLSKKAGGTGVNLIGANRLILFDSDWNPSNDRQAMARIHRDGQKKQCYIYRMLIPGTMDEKIYQRQISKLSLSDSLIDTKSKSGKSADAFSPEELRSIFRLHLDTRCLTHDQMRCPCGGSGIAGAGQGAANVKKRSDDEETDDSDDDDASPPAKFMTASQVHASQKKEKKKEAEVNLSALLEWAHHDCTDEDSAPTQDSILNDMIARQHTVGMFNNDNHDPDAFEMGAVKPGYVVFVYAQSSEKKTEVTSAEISEVSEEDEKESDQEDVSEEEEQGDSE